MDKEEIKKITDYIFLESKPQKADLAFVFGTRHEEALKKVAEVYKQGLVSRILVSGGTNAVTKDNEAEKMSEGLIKLCVKKEDILTEGKSTNSLENVLFSKMVIEDVIGLKNIDTILLIVKHYHSRRALMTLKRHLPKTIALSPVVYDMGGFTKDNWHSNRYGVEKVMSEWQKIPIYLAKGDLEEI